MRVISGRYKGTKLISPHGEVRPTTDTVKESLFSVLTSKDLIAGAKCLDLFCGSGALGIEALSRGASECVFADIDVTNVTANLKKLRLDSRVICADYRRALALLDGEKFDLVFCDPPYKTDYAEKAYALIVKRNMLGRDGVVVLEHARDTRLDLPDGCRIDSRTFGVSAFDIVGGYSESDFCGDI